MAQPRPLSDAERERIYQGRSQEKTIPAIALELDRSEAVVHKWSRRIRAEGVQGLRSRQRGRKAVGDLSSFDPRVRQAALALKRTHRRWGADRVLVELRHDPQFSGVALPSRSRLAVFFKQQCPDCVAQRQPRRPTPTAPPQATAAHEVWQLDIQEKIELADGEVAVICNIRDPFGAAMIGSRAFAAKTAKHWRKLKWTEIRQTLREAFTEWQTLPDSFLTDNELGLAGTPNDPFPGRLTLWLRRLGIKHRFIRPHCPTDQPQIERNHRTLDDLTLDEESRANVPNLQRALDRERQVYNHDFPCRASDCTGRPPLVAHPELLQPRRPYQPEQELALFDLQRVYDFLADFVFERCVSATGVVSLGRCLYSVGRRHAGKRVTVRCDPIHHDWVFAESVREQDDEVERELARRPVKQMDTHLLTGLEPSALPLPQPPIQLTLPCLVP